MLSTHVQSSVEKASDAASIDARWRLIKEHVEARREEICNEIYAYPPPIPACDQQYNYLLEQRTQVRRELRRLDALRQESTTPEQLTAALDAFIRTSAFVDEEAAHTNPA